MKLLLVEDDMEISQMLKDYLRAENYEVVCAADGEEASEKFDSDSYALVLLDLMIPKISGMEVMQHIRQSSTVPIIIVSAKDTDADKTLGLGLGADDYITKPFNIKEVILRINNLIKRSYDDPSKIKMDGYDIDLEKRRVFNGGEEVILTTKEYDLLVYFITNKGLAISREQVLNKVWDENYYGSDRVVDDTLRRLRKKMPEINVRTIYGFGYRLD